MWILTTAAGTQNLNYKIEANQQTLLKTVQKGKLIFNSNIKKLKFQRQPSLVKDVGLEEREHLQRVKRGSKF